MHVRPRNTQESPVSTPQDAMSGRGIKVRTGCKTCKKRKVKCDETKPDCRRCRRMGLICEGYVTGTPKSRYQALLAKRPLIPKTECKPAAIVNFPHNIHFENEQESRYFRLFRQETSVQLAGCYDPTLWGQIILQASHEEACVRHAVAAIAALNMAVRPKGQEGLEEAKSHHEFALQEYGKALKGMQIAVDGEEHIRKALIASILIFTFENLHDSHKTAIANIQNGIKLVQQFLDNRKSSGLATISSPAPHLVEDELVQEFARLDIHVVSHIDILPSGNPQVLNNICTAPLSLLKPQFSSLGEARVYWEHLMRRIAHFMVRVQISKMENESLSSRGERSSGKSNMGDNIPSSLIFDQASFLAEIENWQRSFRPLFLPTLGHQDDPHFIPAAICQITSIATRICVATALLTTPQNADNNPFRPHLLLFSEIARLCDSVATHPRFLKSFVLDTAIVPPLFLLAVKCTDRALRIKGMGILRQIVPRREGLWDAATVLRIAIEVLKAEDRRRDSEREVEFMGPVDEVR